MQSNVVPAGLIDRFLFFALQPVLLVGAYLLWSADPANPGTYLGLIILLQVILGVVEYWRPARPHWRQGSGEKVRNVLIWAVTVIATVFIVAAYEAFLTEPLTQLRQTLHADIWPHGWPLLVQVLMVFFLSEFIWYWIHRAEHRWYPMWRVTGHGAHHAFKKLGAINFGTNHPLEMFWLLLPSALIELFFGVGLAAAGAAVLTGVQASIAHTNVRMNSQVIGWLFTTNDYHIRHHSIVLEESNSNYGCAAIVWDRLFGTFADSAVAEAGTGPTEPSTWQKFLMPLREPAGTDIAPDR